MHALSQEFDPTELPVFIWFVRGAMHSGKKWRSALWLQAMNSRIRPTLCISLKS